MTKAETVAIMSAILYANFATEVDDYTHYSAVDEALSLYKEVGMREREALKARETPNI
jgi:hypothetical protein